MQVHELWHINAQKSEIRNNKINLNHKGHTIVKAVYSLVSTGTERLVCTGSVPDSLHDAMKVPAMEGRFKMPIKYGYSLVGEIIEGSKALTGKKVHLMHPHQDFLIADNLDFSIIPENISIRSATLASLLETAINAMWDSKISVGDEVLVCGFGILGALAAILFRQIPAVHVRIFDSDTKRRKVAAGLGFELYYPGKILKGGFDIALNTTASEDALQLCIDSTIVEGTIVELSWYGNKKISLQLGDAFHIGRKRIISSQVSRIPLDKAEHYNNQRRKAIVFKLLEHNIFDRLPLTEVPFSQSPGLFDLLRNNNYHDFCSIIKY